MFLCHPSVWHLCFLNDVGYMISIASVHCALSDICRTFVGCASLDKNELFWICV